MVVSDRRNLDKQLQDNIYQIEHKQGVVVKIDEDRNSSDLADELNKGTKIIITTLQKFSFLMGKVEDLSDRTFAVIVDEAHSSQGGRSASNLRGVLGGLEKAEAEEAEGEDPPDMEDLILAEAKTRDHSRISIYTLLRQRPNTERSKCLGCAMQRAIRSRSIFTLCVRVLKSALSTMCLSIIPRTGRITNCPKRLKTIPKWMRARRRRLLRGL